MADRSFRHIVDPFNSDPMDPDKVFFSHDFLASFIEEYKQHPSLWDVKSKDYINNPARQTAWEQLLIFCESRLGCVDLEWLKRKVHSMKGSFNKELKKMKDARRSGFTGEWQPKLWYYENLLFTKSHEFHGLSFLKEDFDAESETGGTVLQTGDRYGEGERQNGWTGYLPNEETNSTADTDQENASNSEGQNVEPFSRKRRASQGFKNNAEKRRSPLENVQVELGKPDDDDVYEAIGKVVASKLRALANLDYTQFIRTDKLINDAIYKGFQKQLTPDCEVTVGRQPQYSSHPTITVSSNPAPHLTPSSFPHQTYNLFLPLNSPSAPLQSPSHTSSFTTATSAASASSSCPPDPYHQPAIVLKSPAVELNSVDVAPHQKS